LQFPHDDDEDVIASNTAEHNREAADAEARERLRERLKALTSDHDRPAVKAPPPRSEEPPRFDPPRPIEPISDPRQPVPFLDPVPENPFQAPSPDPSPPSLQAGRWSVKIIERVVALKTPQGEARPTPEPAGRLPAPPADLLAAIPRPVPRGLQHRKHADDRGWPLAHSGRTVRCLSQGTSG
jgi:hypothetical protein